jgi:hypothetical protein
MPLTILTGVTVNAAPLQAVADMLFIAGAGVRVTSTLNGVPVHVPATGVTLYVTTTGALVVFVRIPVTEVAPMPGVPPR